MQKLLAIIARPPYADHRLFELIDAALVAAVFDYQVTLLFIEDGVQCLRSNQDGRLMNQRDFAKHLLGLDAYDIDRLFACSDSLAERGINQDCMAAKVIGLNSTEQSAMIAAQDVVLSL